MMSPPSSENAPDDAGQWTHVVRKGPHAARRPAPSPPVLNSLFPRRTCPPMTLSEIREDHARFTRQWRGYPSRKSLTDLIAANRVGRCPVAQALCLGNGTFDPPSGSWVEKRCAHVQTAVFLDIVKALKDQTGQAIPCFFQEPRYTDADKAFLQELGHTVVETPTAFRMVDASTLVFGIHLYKGHYAMALANCSPAMFVGSPWDLWERLSLYPYIDKIELEGVHRMHSVSDRFDLPREENDNDFATTCLYWRRVGSAKSSQLAPEPSIKPIGSVSESQEAPDP